MSIKYKNYYITSFPAKDEYKCRQRKNKMLEPFFFLTRKGFKKLKDEHDDIQVIGDVKLLQQKYKEIDSDTVESEKLKRKIKGTVMMKQAQTDEYQKYDLYEQNNFRHCVGYAMVGETKYVRLVKFSPLFILLFLLLALLLIGTITHCPKVDPIPIVIGDDITEQQEEMTDSPICYYVPFEEITVLDKEHPNFVLSNVESNKDTYYISYQVFINDVPMTNKDGSTYSTGAIPPGKQVSLNLWKQLDKGVYEIKVIATDYDYKLLKELSENEKSYSSSEYASLLSKAMKPVSHTLTTTLKIVK